MVTSENPDTQSKPKQPESPKWNWTTKLVIALALVAVAVWVLVQFQNFLGPLITALILTYLIHPVANFLKEKIRLPWRLSVTVIYIILVLAILGLLTWGGFTLSDQIQNLLRFITNNIDQLPDLVAEITERTYQIGPITFSPSGFNWDEITNQIVSAIQPILGRLGSVASSIAAGAVSIITWTGIILLISYFLLVESEGIPSKLLNVQIPGYSKDIEKMGTELNKIWNAFIRGEILVVLISWSLYTATLGLMGVQFFYGLAVIAAVGQLIPYLGAWVTWISFGLVALFQNNIPFNLAPGIYMVIVLGVSMLVNYFLDSIIRTKIMASNLKVHPAVVLIGALIGLQFFGFIGIIIAAPVMASLKLFLNYVIKKLSDQDPWLGLDVQKPAELPRWWKFTREKWHKFANWLKHLWQKIWRKELPHRDESSPEKSEKSQDA